MSTRIVSLAAAVVLALSSVACMAPATTESESGKNGKSEGGSLANLGEKPSAATADASGTCAASCAHYLECKGASSTDNQNKCVDDCKGLGLTASQLAAFEQADCASAIAMVEGPPSSSSSSSGASGSTKGSECNGCVRDGSSCIWLSQSNWGSGPYSGAAAECSSYCCE